WQAPRNLDAASAVVAQEKLDVLVYPDIGMEVLTYFMAFARLALVQYAVRLMGHPVTPSTGAVDYFLSLDVELEDGQNDYMEQMVRVNLINTAHLQQAFSAGVASVLKNAEENDEGAVLEQRDGNAGSTTCRQNYLVLGRIFKFHADFDAAIKIILARDPGGYHLKWYPLLGRSWSSLRYIYFQTQIGIDDCVRIVHHSACTDVLRRASAVLDTFPYGDCLTILQVKHFLRFFRMSHGVPVVTLPAKFIRGRFALAMYKQMGYTDLVATDLEEYASFAIKLGTQRDFRERSVARMEGGYRSLHRNNESADEWGAFFRRALRAA
ncbi:unnamed protein product, partial [Ascophyllum nodosum]